MPVPTGYVVSKSLTGGFGGAHLLDEVGGLGEVLDEVELEVGALGSSASVRRRATNDNRAV